MNQVYLQLLEKLEEHIKVNNMRMLIVRSYGSVMNVGNYNIQEIGLAKAFVKKGLDTDIVFYGGDNESRIQYWQVENGKNIKLYWLKGREVNKHGIMPEVYRLAESYDYLWLDEFNQYTSYILAKKYKGKAFIYHGPYPPKYSMIRLAIDKITSRMFFNKELADNIQVFTKSNLAKDSLMALGFKKVEAIGVGLDTARFQNAEAIDLNDFGIKKTEKVILYIGSIDDRRNTIFLLKVFKEIKKDNADLKLLLVGKAKSKYWERCERYINENGLSSYIVHVNNIPQTRLPEVYRRASLFLFPTQYEIFGMVLMEAMFFGVPVLTSNNGGSSTLIESGKNGVICELRIKDWVETVNKLLSDAELCEQLSQNAKHTIEDDFSWDSIAEHAIKYMKGVATE